MAQPNQHLVKLLAEQGLDAILFFGLPNIRYLCGFTGSDGVLLVCADETVFLTDSRYQTQAAQQVSAQTKICYKNKFSSISAELQKRNLTKLGFDAEAVTVAAFDELSKLAGEGIAWVPLTEQLKLLRARKTSSELAALGKAAALNKQAFAEVLPQMKPGISERQVALALESALKRLGGETIAFDIIVASGTRGALPHGIASDKLLVEGELITIDFGTRVDGYYSDETVTLALGEVNGKLRQIFDIVLQAHDLALAAVRPGISARELDEVARNHIVAQGYGDFFGHGLGHGVGLEVHEYPAVSQRTEAVLEEGMVITIEPGIYIPGTGGVRIEDTVVVTATGYEALTQITKKFNSLSCQ